MITLRPYQEDILEAIRDYIRKGVKRIVLCAPTGSGKTRVFSYMAYEHLKRGFSNRVLILTNRIELLTQAGGALYDMGIIPEKITADNRKINRRARCFVAMVDTYWNRLKTMPDLAQMSLIIIDEAHYGSFFRLFAKWDELKCSAVVIGATATPISAKKDRPLSDLYQGLVNVVQIGDLIEQGYLSPAVTYSAKIDRSKLKKDSTGDYSDASQMDAYAKREVYGNLLEKYQAVCAKYNGGKPIKTIVFNVNVAHSMAVTAEFNSAGIPARHIDGTTDWAERTSTLAAYKSGAFPVICNVGILNAGFDDPETACIVMNRATTSVPLWLQSCGRASRIAPGKERFVIIDMGENWRELGLWESERDWEALYSKKKRDSDKEGVAPVKDCDQCGALVAIQLRECPECGYVFPVKEKAEPKEAEFVEITPDLVPPTLSPELAKLDRPAHWPTLPVEHLFAIQSAKGRKSGWVIHTIRNRSQTEEQFREELSEFARLKGYKRGWVEYQVREWAGREAVAA